MHSDSIVAEYHNIIIIVVHGLSYTLILCCVLLDQILVASPSIVDILGTANSGLIFNKLSVISFEIVYTQLHPTGEVVSLSS